MLEYQNIFQRNKKPLYGLVQWISHIWSPVPATKCQGNFLPLLLIPHKLNEKQPNFNTLNKLRTNHYFPHKFTNKPIAISTYWNQILTLINKTVGKNSENIIKLHLWQKRTKNPIKSPVPDNNNRFFKLLSLSYDPIELGLATDRSKLNRHRGVIIQLL